MSKLKQLYNAWMGNEAVRFFIIGAFFFGHASSLLRDSKGIVFLNKSAGVLFLLVSLYLFAAAIYIVATRFRPRQVGETRYFK